MTYEELIQEKDYLEESERILRGQIEEIDHKIKLARSSKATDIYKNILEELKELNSLGYTITARCTDERDYTHYHEYSDDGSLECLEFTKLDWDA